MFRMFSVDDLDVRSTEKEYPITIYDVAALASARLAHRALAATETALLRCLLVIFAARAKPPTSPPRRPNSDITREISGGPGRSWIFDFSRVSEHFDLMMGELVENLVPVCCVDVSSAFAFSVSRMRKVQAQ
jgi:hypothetical protein